MSLQTLLGPLISAFFISDPLCMLIDGETTDPSTVRYVEELYMKCNDSIVHRTQKNT